MEVTNWIPSLSIAGLVAVVLWLARNMIVNRLKRSVEHEFNVKLEQVRSEVRAREDEIAFFRARANTAFSTRQVEVEKRRLQAIDQLWEAVIELGRAKSASSLTGSLEFDVAANAAEHNPKVRAFFETVAGGLDPTKLNLAGGDKARPFVSPLAWAYYSAIRVIALQALMKLEMLKGGINMAEAIDQKEIKKLITAALPQHKQYIDTYGDTGYHFLLDELENLLLEEFRRMQEGTEADKDRLAKAAEILELSNKLQEQIRRDSKAGVSMT